MGILDALFGTNNTDTSKTNTPGGSHDGIQESIPGNGTLTVNSTGDKSVVGGYYVTVKDNDTGNKATSVHNSDGTFADVKANNIWVDAPNASGQSQK